MPPPKATDVAGNDDKTKPMQKPPKMREDTTRTNVKAAAADFTAIHKRTQCRRNQRPQTKPMPTKNKPMLLPMNDAIRGQRRHL